MGQNTTNYDEQLNKITSDLLEMGKTVEEMVHIAKKAIKTPEKDFYPEARTIDKTINQMDTDIENTALNILAERQPMATDLRIVTSSLKMCSYFERMGDLAKKVTKKASQPDITINEKALKDFNDLSDVINSMISDTLDAFRNKDIKKALSVWKRDDEVDQLYHDIYNRIVKSMQDDPEHLRSYMHIASAAKSYERIGDYITKLAAMIYYIISGEHFSKSALEEKSVAS